MAAFPTSRTKAFISYSHQDSRYLDELHLHLAYFEKQGLIDFWDDRKLVPGTRWQQDIRQAIKSARVAILLVSASFLASDFVTGQELPPLLEAAQKEGALLLSVIVRPCLFKHTALAQFQAVNDPSKPMSELPPGKRDQIWARVAELIAEALDNQKAAAAAPGGQEKTPKKPSRPQKTREQWLEEAEAQRRAGHAQEALAAYERALQLDATSSGAQKGKDTALRDLEAGGSAQATPSAPAPASAAISPQQEATRTAPAPQKAKTPRARR